MDGTDASPGQFARYLPDRVWLTARSNAVAESFFATLQTELLDRQRWTTRKQLAQAIFEWIEVFYNRQRRHSTLGMLDPVTYHQTRHSTPAA